MKLNALIGKIPGEVSTKGNTDIEIAELCVDSRRATPGALFFCTPGLRLDAHDFAPQAVEKGAAALIVERFLPLDVPQVKVEDVRVAVSYVASEYFGNPSEKLMMLGITGTKGKTTTSFLVKAIMEAAGIKTGLIGTVCSMIGDETLSNQLTTPDPIEMQTLLRRMVDAGMECVIMEVSAHALAMHRLAGVRFKVAAFSNFSQDHLDYFPDMDAYFAAKMKLFAPDVSENVVYLMVLDTHENIQKAHDALTAEPWASEYRIKVRVSRFEGYSNMRIFDASCSLHIETSKAGVFGMLAAYSGQELNWDDVVTNGKAEFPAESVTSWDQDPPIHPDTTPPAQPEPGQFIYENSVPLPGFWKWDN